MRLSEETTAKFETELADKQIQKVKKAINDCQLRFGKVMGCGVCKSLQLCTWVKELCDTIECMKKHIETLQQEIEQHIKWNEAHTKARVEQAELIDKLLKDKDELAGRLMQYDTVLKQAREALQDSIAYGLFKDDFNFRKTTCYETIKKVTNSIDTLLGSKENGKM